MVQSGENIHFQRCILDPQTLPESPICAHSISFQQVSPNIEFYLCVISARSFYLTKRILIFYWEKKNKKKPKTKKTKTPPRKQNTQQFNSCEIKSLLGSYKTLQMDLPSKDLLYYVKNITLLKSRSEVQILKLLGFYTEAALISQS